MDGCPLGLGLVVEDKPTEFSCTCMSPLLSYITTQALACAIVNVGVLCN